MWKGSLWFTLMQMNAWMCRRIKKVDQKKVKIWPAPTLLEKDIVVLSRHNWKMLWRSRELYWAKLHNFNFNEPHQIHLNPFKIWCIRHLSCYLLAMHCCLSSKGLVIWSTALWQLQLTCYHALWLREKIRGSDGGLSPVKKMLLLLQQESWFMNTCLCGIYFLSGKGKWSKGPNVLSERVCKSGCGTKDGFFRCHVEICDKVL